MNLMMRIASLNKLFMYVCMNACMYVCMNSSFFCFVFINSKNSSISFF